MITRKRMYEIARELLISSKVGWLPALPEIVMTAMDAAEARCRNGKRAAKDRENSLTCMQRAIRDSLTQRGFPRLARSPSVRGGLATIALETLMQAANEAGGQVGQGIDWGKGQADG